MEKFFKMDKLVIYDSHVHNGILKQSYRLLMPQYNVQKIFIHYVARHNIGDIWLDYNYYCCSQHWLDEIKLNKKAKEGSYLSYGKPHQHHQNSTNMFSPETKAKQIKKYIYRKRNTDHKKDWHVLQEQSTRSKTCRFNWLFSKQMWEKIKSKSILKICDKI